METLLETLKNILTYVILASCVISILIIVLQADKGGGLGSLFGGSGSQSVLGSRKADFIQKLTGVFLGIFIIGSFTVAYLTKVTENIHPDKNLSEQIQKSSKDETGTKSDKAKEPAKSETAESKSEPPKSDAPKETPKDQVPVETPKDNTQPTPEEKK